jgi:hypothetical protein
MGVHQALFVVTHSVAQSSTRSDAGVQEQFYENEKKKGAFIATTSIVLFLWSKVIFKSKQFLSD